MSTVVRLSEVVDDVRYDTAVEALQLALDRTVNGYKTDPDFKATACVVLMLDQNGGRYSIKRHVSSMKTSEIIALLEICKAQELRLLEPCLGEY